MKQENNLCYWEAPCAMTPRPRHGNMKLQPRRGKKKSLEAKIKGRGKKKKAHLAEEADSIKFTYNREHTDITSSTILRQEDKEKERQTEGTDKKDKSADNQLLMG